MPVYINGSYDNLVYGEDGVSPMKPALERYLNMAKQDACRLRIEVRVKPQGAPSTQQEHQWEVDTTEVTVDGLLRHICDKLDESPGEAFAGEIRLNFSQAGSSGTRYGSFTRTVYPATTAGNYAGATGGGGFGGGFGGSGGYRRGPPEEMDEGGEDEGGEDEVDNASGVLDGEGGMPPARFPRMAHRGGPPMAPVGGGGIWMDEAALRTWLETVWGFNFRQQASMLAMFDRATKMMEAIALRFGMPEAVQQRSIVDTRAAPAAAEGAGGMGLLPMLLKAAAHLANSDSPAEVAQKAGSMAAGEPPPDGAARMLAVRGAGNLVRTLRAGGRPAPPAAPSAPAREAGPPPDDDGDGSGETYDGGEDEEESAYDDGEGGDEGYEEDGGDAGGGSFEDLPPDELMEKLAAWVQKDPSRKGEIMKRSGQLMKLMQ